MTKKPSTKNLSVMKTPEMREHLEVLKEAFGDQSEATRWALKIAAHILEFGWLAGFEERGKVPQFRVQYKAKKPTKQPA